MKYRGIIITTLISLAALGLIVMTLANNKEDLAQEAKLSLMAAKSIPVYSTQLKEINADQSITATGCLKAHRELVLHSETQGRVDRIRKRKGDYIKRGELVVAVADDVFRAQLLVAEANFEQAKRDLKRSEKLKAGDAISKQQLEQAKVAAKQTEAAYISAKKQFDDTSIEAPFSGEIVNDFIENGTLLTPGMKICELVDISRLKMIVKVTEREVLDITKGQEVKVKVGVIPGKNFHGIVKSIGAKADHSMKFDVEIVVENETDQKLRAGMYADVLFESRSNEKMLLLERKALVNGLKDPKVYVIKEQKAFVKPIVIGRTINDKVEVISGITPSDLVVLSGQINLKNGIAVNVLK